MSTCNYCHPKSETVLWEDARCRVILADEAGFTGWCRVVWQDHVRELSDLSAEDLNHLMKIVAIVERALIAELKPVKMNIAALGTASPHLHFHVIARFEDDATFPEPVWLERRHRNVAVEPATVAARLRPAVSALLGSN